MTWFSIAIMLCACLAASACGDNAPDAACELGDAAVQACSCSDGRSGALMCDSAADGGMSCSCGASGQAGTTGGAGSGGRAGTSAQTDDIDSGTASGDDAGVNGAGEHDAAVGGGGTAGVGGAGVGGNAGSGGKDAPTYDGPCNNDKGCPGAETCERAGGVSYCAAECMKSSDCPAAKSGKATPTCVGANVLLSQPGTCALSCGGLLAGACPNDMECSSLLLLSGTCAWPDML
jgi:hypothetical protein